MTAKNSLATFERRYVQNANTGCWLWQGYLNKDGYGKFSLSGRVYKAHQAAMVLFGRDVPQGAEIDHKCRVRHCVNPDHLEAVTHRENVRRGDIGKWQRVKTHCKSGHPLSGKNLYVGSDGFRYCRTCRMRWAREYNRRKEISP
jgi:hypothetical protein